MKHLWQNCLRNNAFFWIFSIFSLLLIVASFVLPPIGMIDPSVLTAVGEIMGFAALGAICKALDKGVDATLKHNDTEITINNNATDIK